MSNFNAKEETKNCIEWIRHWFLNESGNAKGVVLGISGGKDSTIVAALLCKAIGKENIVGILMPNGLQKDIEDSKRMRKVLEIKSMVVNIGSAYDHVVESIVENQSNHSFELSKQTKINIAPRIRMTTLFTIGQQLSYRVAGTGNLSERYIGYSTKWGDTASDFNPIACFTSNEVIAIGEALELPHDLIYKTPADGLSGKSDEENFEFSYTVLNRYIREGVCEDETIKRKIDKMHGYNHHKLDPIPIYLYKV